MMKVLIDIQPQADGSFAIGDGFADIADQLNRGKTSGDGFLVLDSLIETLERHQVAVGQAIDIMDAGGESDAFEQALEEHEEFIEALIDAVQGEL